MGVALALLLGCQGAPEEAAELTELPAVDVEVQISGTPRTVPSLSGLVHNLPPEGPDAGLEALELGMVRGEPHTASPLRAAELGADYVLVVPDIWGYPFNNWKGKQAPYEDWEAYESALRVSLADADPAWVFEVWNEPDALDFWVGTPEQFLETYTRTVRVIDEVLPGARVAGPSLAVYDPVLLEAFLEGCGSLPGCRVDILAQHSFPGLKGSPGASAEDFLALQQLAQDHTDLGIEALWITEVGGPDDQYLPGSSVAVLWAMEQAEVQRSARACWERDDGSSNCFNNSADGLLDPGDQSPLPAWWVYAAHAAGRQTRVDAESSDPRIYALASLDQVLVGYGRRPETAETETLSLRVRSGPTLPEGQWEVLLLPAQGEQHLSAPERIPVDWVLSPSGAAVDLPPLAPYGAMVLQQVAEN